MTHWWRPTGDSYLRHVTKARIIEAVTEGVWLEAAENLTKLKKDVLAAEAEQRLKGTTWLPAMLRTPVATAAEPEPDANCCRMN
jgi:ParB family chromosome partitioning protein